MNKKKRYLILYSIVLIMVTSSSHMLYAKLLSKQTYTNRNYVEITVEKGDTIWNISLKYTPKNKDVRKTVYEIRKLNNIDNSIIIPGQIIKVPIDN
ncbi:MAG: LysM peptidoglycan-binding domain-containing protein [Clostridiales bacterium]|nr:LysM peptidoglycan-binding domain-containing protein [Clostridiales bacterium]